MRNNNASTVFNKNLTKALKYCIKKKCDVLCMVIDGDIYVCGGYIMVKLTEAEYEEFVRPIFKRNPGNFYLDQWGDIIDDAPDYDKRAKNLHEVFIKCFTAEAFNQKCVYTEMMLRLDKVEHDLTVFYGAEEDQVEYVDELFVSAAEDVTWFRLDNDRHALLFTPKGEPAMLICSVDITRVGQDDIKAEFKEAVRHFVKARGMWKVTEQ